MPPTSRWGITLPLTGLPLPAQRELVAALPGLGYTDAWSAEVSGADAFTPLALAAGWAPELRLGTAIAGIYNRGPALLAMSAATVAALAPGRFVLGIGVSSPVVVTAWNGVPLERPYQRARDMLRFLRPALAGEKVSMTGDTFSVSGLPAGHAARPAARPGPGRAAAADGRAGRGAGRRGDHQLAGPVGRAHGAGGGRAGL